MPKMLHQQVLAQPMQEYWSWASAPGIPLAMPAQNASTNLKFTHSPLLPAPSHRSPEEQPVDSSPEAGLAGRCCLYLASAFLAVVAYATIKQRSSYSAG